MLKKKEKKEWGNQWLPPELLPFFSHKCSSLADESKESKLLSLLLLECVQVTTDVSCLLPLPYKSAMQVSGRPGFSSISSYTSFQVPFQAVASVKKHCELLLLLFLFLRQSPTITQGGLKFSATLMPQPCKC